jgi:signal peptidase I
MAEANPETVESAPAAPKEDGFVELIKAVLWALGIAVVLRSLLFSPFNIPTGSMISNLLVGDYLFVNKFSYGYSRYSFPFGPPLFSGRIFASPPKRGDIVVFKLPRDNSTDYIKRIVGLPGDRIEMRDGVLFINEQMVSKERLADKEFRETPNADCSQREPYRAYRVVKADGKVWCRLPQYRETMPDALGGRHYVVTDLVANGPTDNTGTFIVPDKHYFAMGDNRDDSLDSRVDPSEGGVGFVPDVNLVGRAEFRFFSTDGSARWYNPVSWFTAVRTDRLFTSIQ